MSEHDPIIGPWTPERCEKKKITPKQAKQLLDQCNTRNRTPVEHTIQLVKTALTDGRWQCNGETIIFAKDGTLLDGQNRLLGCVEASQPLVTYVVFGQSADAFQTIDRGRSRNVASDLSIAGYSDSRSLCAVAQIVCSYLDGNRDGSLVNALYDYRALLALLKEHPGIVDSNAFGTSTKRRILCPQRIVGAVHYLAGLRAREAILFKRDEFFNRLVDGVGLEKGNAVLCLREKFVAMNQSPTSSVKRGMGRYAALVYLHSMVRCWNAFVSGNHLSRITLNYADASKQNPGNMPDIKNGYRMRLEASPDMQENAEA